MLLVHDDHRYLLSIILKITERSFKARCSNPPLSLYSHPILTFSMSGFTHWSVSWIYWFSSGWHDIYDINQESNIMNAPIKLNCVHSQHLKKKPKIASRWSIEFTCTGTLYFFFFWKIPEGYTSRTYNMRWMATSRNSHRMSATTVEEYIILALESNTCRRSKDCEKHAIYRMRVSCLVQS